MLYQTVRPTKLSEMFGNENAVAAVQHLLKQKDRPHTILLQGPSGCGKTTLARVIALELGAAAESIIEKNAAQERGIEMARNVDELCQYSPIQGGCRVIIYDEAHMLTKEAQNGLLKVLEDVPEYQYHILCSTDPQKLLPTMRNRCLKIEVRTLQRDEVMELVVDACDRAGLEFPTEKVIAGIAKIVDGCPREALMLLEKVAGLREAEAMKLVESFRGSEAEVIDLCRAIVKGAAWTEITKMFEGLSEADAEQIRYAVLGYLKSCMVRAKSIAAARKFALMIHEFKEPTYSSGKPGLITQIYFAMTESADA